jgi:hypothetical protein
VRISGCSAILRERGYLAMGGQIVDATISRRAGRG